MADLPFPGHSPLVAGGFWKDANHCAASSSRYSGAESKGGEMTQRSLMARPGVTQSACVPFSL